MNWLKVLFCLAIHLQVSAQDSTYYNIFWKPKHVDKEAKVSRESVYSYQVENNVIKDSSLFEVCGYDSLGQVISQQQYFNNKLSTQRLYFYTNNKLDSMRERRSLPSTNILYTYQYDSVGHLAMMSTFNREGISIMQYRYVYYRNLLQQVFIRYGMANEQLLMQFAYDDSTHWINKINCMSSEKFGNYTYLFKYADKGQAVTRYILWPKGKPSVQSICIYNEKNQMLKKTSFQTAVQAFPKTDIGITWDAMEEEFTYTSKGILQESQIKIKGKLFQIKRHFYL